MSGKRIIFLDFDGVVACSKKFWKHPERGFEPNAIAELNRLAERSGAEVVPITSRLRWQTVSWINWSLKQGGFTGTIHEGLDIPKMKFAKQILMTRGKALETWCKTHGINPEDCVILDNNYPKNLPETLVPRLIQTDSYMKLTTEDVDKALALFGITPEAAEGVYRTPHASGLRTDWAARHDREHAPGNMLSR